MNLSEEHIRIIFGLKMKQLRNERRLSLSELSKRSGLSVSYLNEIEKGKKYPKSNKIIALSDALKVPYDQLVSLKLTKKLAPLGELLESNLLDEIPLELFGIEPSKLIEIIATAPAKVNAFISTLIQIARNYNVSQEHFYMSALRSYQESHDNYFEEIEQASDDFRKKYSLDLQADKVLTQVEIILCQKYNYHVNYTELNRHSTLDHLRFVILNGTTEQLLINNRLTDAQKAFIIGRELGYNFMQLTERPKISPMFEVKSFDYVLNNFKASYFSGALLIQRTQLIEDVKQFVTNRQWDSQLFYQIMCKYTTSPDMFIQRLTNLLPRFFKLNNLFFMRFNNEKGTKKYQLTKELHFSQLHSPQGNETQEHYCRRWVVLEVLQQLEKQTGSQPVIGVQRSQFLNSSNEYFVIAVAKPMAYRKNLNYSVGIGFLLDKDLKRRLRFWKDPEIRLRTVNQTCERCPIIDCNERVAPPVQVEQQQKNAEMKNTIEAIAEKMQKE